jgi:hypothetical protein
MDGYITIKLFVQLIHDKKCKSKNKKDMNVKGRSFGRTRKKENRVKRV